MMGSLAGRLLRMQFTAVAHRYHGMQLLRLDV